MTQKRSPNSLLKQVLAISLCGLIAGPLARSQDSGVVCDPTDPKKCSLPLSQGEIAPFDGQLLTTKLAIDLGQKAESFGARLELELSYQKKLLSIDLELEKKLRENDRISHEQQVKLLTKRLEEVSHTSWYESPIFISGLSVVTTVLVFIGVGYVIKSID